MMKSDYDQFFNDDPWKGMDIGSYPAGRRLYLNDDRFWVSVDELGRRLFFIHENFNFNAKIFEQLSSLKIELDDSYNDSTRLICTLLEDDEDSRNKFSIISKNIAFSTSDFFGRDLFLKVQLKIREWSNFLKPTRAGLSSPELIGFIGEFYFFKKYLLEFFSFSDATRFWIGPSGKKQDVTLNRISIEIKTSLAGDAKTIKISSLEQLEKTVPSLYLIHFNATPAQNSKDSISLRRLHDECLEMIKYDIGMETTFLSKISYLYGQASEEQLDFNFLIVSEVLYCVDENFPKLTGENVPVGIFKANYELSIEGLKGSISKESINQVVKNG
ncbi:PD-(D/E)XK motif protein [Marinomonas sp. TI.3.20]|uniref:PD-(D/E)XK motif protein n=1 Tax=Marinomonas sp. TI.3.20 TaxID=3121296 RepID=UPI0031201867